ncbi:YciI family protein [Planctomonas sp. JC2975]|uniref:YciI family protein n=1 Tax=Planctomonas sp. JC2975 TaxID=2729626 RepID=UPI0014732FFD|nr:YciI family protein [Planctomonas sp. JC2975]NNC10740.1 YciI family protein [Planctomonas sp. JC2975]
MKYMLLQASDPTRGDGEAAGADPAAMDAFNDRLIRAGVLLAGDGLEVGDAGIRVSYSGDGRAVTAGALSAPSEPVCGFWILQVASREEAVEWARRMPLTGGTVEVRKVLDSTEPDTRGTGAGRARLHALDDTDEDAWRTRSR